MRFPFKMLLLGEGGDRKWWGSTVIIPGKYSFSSHGFWWHMRNPGCGKYALGLRTVSSCTVLWPRVGLGDQSTAGMPASGNLLDHD